VCPDFDPDQANAYVERSLTGASRSQFEAHLSDCAACRKGVVALLRMAEADTLTAPVPARESSRSTWLSGAKRMFGALSQPQWAMAAAAVIVLAISLPLLLSRNRVPESSPAAARIDGAKGVAESASPAANATRTEAAPQMLASAKQSERSDEKIDALAKNAPATPTVAESTAIDGAVADLSKKPESTGAAQPTDEQRQAEGRLAQTPAQGGAAPGSQVAKSDSDQGRQQQTEKDAAQQPAEARAAARADEPSAKKENEVRAEEAAPPPSPAPSSDAARSRAGMRQPGKLALRDSAGELARADERKYGGKTFLFRDGAWTDKNYDPNKDLPFITLIRDSNVYKELLSKRAGLKSIMDRFSPTERAIVVYKGTVYKLIPQ